MSALSNAVKRLTGSDFLGQVAEGAFSSIYVKDYAHAARLFGSDNLALAPRQKFLFHVFFTLRYPDNLQISNNDKGIIGALVQNIQLPSFTLDTQEYIQYNRKRLVHNRVKYNPISVTFHDDSADNIRQMWAKYFQYYFDDSSYSYEEGLQDEQFKAIYGPTDYNGRDIYNEVLVRQAPGWGKTIAHAGPDGRKLPFFKDIKIFGLSGGNFASYTLINPVITQWTHDTYDYSAGTGLMTHQAQIQYEAVKYGAGKISEIVTGFGKDHPHRYDPVAGSLGPGDTTSVFGTGGLLDVGKAVSADLASGNVGGALKVLGTAARSYGSVDNLVNVVKGDVGAKVIADATASIGAAAKSATSSGGALSFPSVGEIYKNLTATPKSDS